MPRNTDSSAPGAAPRRWSKTIDQDAPACRVIDAFGGLTPFCEATDFATSTAHGWLTRGFIPQDNWPWILDAAKKIGLIPMLRIRDFIDWRTIEADF